METILVTSIGSFSADIVIKKLKLLNYRVIGIDVNQKELIVDAYNVDKFYVAPYSTEEKKYIEFIKKLIYSENIKYIFPLTDFEIDVFNKYRDEFISLCTICISSETTLNICRDKNSTYKFLLERGFDDILIPTYLLSEKDKDSLCYPIVAKPLDGRSSQGLNYIDSKERLKLFYSMLNDKEKEKYIMQPKIDGCIVTVDVLRNPISNNIVSVARKEMLRTLNGAGTSVYIYKDSTLEKIVNKLATELNVKGCVNFEFIFNEKKKKYYFVECNPRFSGGVEFSCIAAYDMITNHLKVFQNVEIDSLLPFKSQYIARKYEEYVTRIEEV